MEAGIEKDSRLQDIDLRVKEEYLETLTKFYQVLVMSTVRTDKSIFIAMMFFSVLSQYKGTGRTLSS